MTAKNYYMILDTETCDNFVFDLGYKLIDRNGNTVNEGSYVVSEFINDPSVLDMFNDPFTKTKIANYYYNLYANTGAFEVLPFDEIMAIVNSLIRTFNAKVCAYNAAFDVKHLDLTAQAFGYDGFFLNDIEVYDIWNMALSTICNSRNYVKFVMENNLVSAKGNPSSGAEAVYCYLTNDPNFVEQHTAHEDCKIEAIIFVKVMRKHKKFDRDFVGMCLHNKDWKGMCEKANAYR